MKTDQQQRDSSLDERETLLHQVDELVFNTRQKTLDIERLNVSKTNLLEFCVSPTTTSNKKCHKPKMFDCQKKAFFAEFGFVSVMIQVNPGY